MKAFDLYAAYYDLLYRDKDYESEVAYVTDLLCKAGPTPNTVLELGCGTGGHADGLAKRGFSVHGIDSSAAMIERAHRRADLLTHSAHVPRFEQADIRKYRAAVTFDAVISLFHVMSYQTSNSDQDESLSTARAHLERGGVLFFDFWYGPAVLSDRPRVVTKEVSDERIAVRRETRPKVHVNENCVEVRFDVYITSRLDGRSEHVVETHMMRYLFLPEIEQRLRSCNFRLLHAYRWMSKEQLSDKSWYGCVVAAAD